MYDSGKIIAGLLVFFVLLTTPFWYNMASGEPGEAPELEKVVGARQCVMDTDYMRAWHMDLLNDWRHSVVRDGNRIHVAPNGQKFEKSLTKTCLNCHKSKERFCDKCHNYAGVSNDCWGCHYNPEGTR